MEEGSEKTILFLRHGHGEHSEGDWQLPDPHLTSNGVEQAKWCGRMIRDDAYGGHLQSALELVVVSPLKRTIQTAISLNMPSVRHTLCPLHSERYYAPCDGGSSEKELKKEFGLLVEDWLGWDWLRDPTYWPITKENDVGWETRRTRAFKEYLSRLVEKTVLVVGHGGFMQKLLGLSHTPAHCAGIWASFNTRTLTFHAVTAKIEEIPCSLPSRTIIWIDSYNAQKYDPNSIREEKKALEYLKAAGWSYDIVDSGRKVHTKQNNSTKATLLISRLSSEKNPVNGLKYGGIFPNLPIVYWSRQLLEEGRTGHQKRCDVYEHWNSVALCLPDELAALRMENEAVLIGITGPSHAGKSTLAKSLERLFVQHKLRVALVQQDRFCEVSVKDLGNWDSPDAVQHLEFKSCVLQTLRSKEFHVVIMEGFLSFFDPLLAAICDVRLHVKCDKEVCAERRLKSQNFSPARYTKQVWPCYLMYEDKISRFDPFCRAPQIFINGARSKEEVFEHAKKALKHLYKFL